MPPWEQISPLLLALGSLLTAVGAVAAAVATASKTAAEAAKIRAELKRVSAELTPNHGSSARDSINRTEAGVAEVVESMRRHDKELSRLHDGQLVLTKTVTEGLDQLHDVDAEDRRRAEQEHQRIWSALEQHTQQEQS